jgi:hypothetical protein
VLVCPYGRRVGLEGSSLNKICYHARNQREQLPQNWQEKGQMLPQIRFQVWETEQRDQEISVLQEKSEEFSVRFAFGNEEIINLDIFTPHRLLYLIGMKSNCLEIQKFIADYFKRKYPSNSF